MTTGPERGFVFAATGEVYVTLARRAARTLRIAIPDAEIDLFTDTPTGDPVFSQEHALSDGFFRPKMEAMRRSRFERTIMLDADILVLTPIPELFDILDQYEMAGVAGISRRRKFYDPKDRIPRAIPNVNTGVLAIRRTEATQTFLGEWNRRVRENGDRLDQPAFRKLLWELKPKFLVLTQEYNLMYKNFLDIWFGEMGYPRVLHVADLHRRPQGDPETPLTPEEALGRVRANHLERLRAADWTLGGDPALRTPLPPPPHVQSTRSLARMLVQSIRKR
ncbi:putative nucleotide-diphospho-sugar transferase [Palleronia sp. LCG004]|uniref:putative nucleotide-diphospho-sugar transferase n=1 Tax=Palleronia sp. LCG004 TaxID=3079304 RepID=UPI00294280E1|nr:putative nucleotide-diphospho-sugar transferase [Palleronia sp. LCG004]WOI56901.1 putative nucleotide-diphospho-sugar transferase [Palleronia sp. LCG004]